jgi:hypothetical protein
MYGLASGEAPRLRLVGPFTDMATCEAALSAENPALWRSAKCFNEWEEATVPTFRIP